MYEHFVYLSIFVKVLIGNQTNFFTQMKAVNEEFTESIAKKHGISEFRSKAATKNFAFNVPDVNVPMTCEYLEVC